MVAATINDIRALIDIGHFLDVRGLCPATSGNFSVRVDDQTALITASGRHKGYLTADDLLLVDLQGHAIGSDLKPSAETLLHTSLYARDPEIGSVLHTHSLTGTVLSRVVKAPALRLEGYEILKIFPGIKTHDTWIEVPFFDNRQEMAPLAKEIETKLSASPNIFGYFLRGHGLYTWGKTLEEARWRIEAFEFLFACEVKIMEIGAR